MKRVVVLEKMRERVEGWGWGSRLGWSSEPWLGERCWSPSHTCAFVQSRQGIHYVFVEGWERLFWPSADFFCGTMYRMERNRYLLSAKQALLFFLGAKCTGWLDIRGVQTNYQSLHCIPFMYGQPCWPFSTWDQLVLCGLLPTPTNSTPKCECSLLPLYPCSNLLSTGI